MNPRRATKAALRTVAPRIPDNPTPHPTATLHTTTQEQGELPKDVEACISKCVYYCQKPKGSEQKGRKECYGECKVACKANPKAKFNDDGLVQ